jgi:hypothetical protein
MLGAVINPQEPPPGMVTVALPEYEEPVVPAGKLEDQLGAAGVTTGAEAVVIPPATDLSPKNSKLLARRIVITTE